MDETRIPKDVERILLLDSETPQVLFKRPAKKKNEKLTKFTKSIREAMMAMAEVPRRGTEVVLEQIPGDGDVMGHMGNAMTRFRKRGMRMLRGKKK